MIMINSGREWDWMDKKTYSIPIYENVLKQNGQLTVLLVMKSINN